LLVVMVLSTACATDQPETTPGDQEGRTVVAGIYPLFEAAQRVGGDRVMVSNLTAPGVEPHDLELTTSQVDSILDADLLVYIGDGFQPAIEESAGRMSGRTLDVLEEDEEGADPHVWLDPRRMSDIVGQIESVLAELDPEGRDGYTARADAYRTELAALDEAFEAGLSDCDRDLIVTNHASFGYLADRYGLRQEAISGLSPESEPDPARLAELTDLVEAEGVTTVFTETLASPRVAETLAREAGVTVAVLDPLEGLTDAGIQQGRTYVTVMEDNLDAIRAALGCR
jgi:zinc transport system substrate-binding protein